VVLFQNRWCALFRLTMAQLHQFASALKNSAAYLQDATTAPCLICGGRVLRTKQLECEECRAPCCWSCVAAVYSYDMEQTKTSGPRTCKLCYDTVLQRIRKVNVEKRLVRVEAFLRGCLEPYVYSPETKVQQSLRLGEHALGGATKVIRYVPIASYAVDLVKASYYIVRYGPLVLAGNDVIDALVMLVGLARKVETPVKAKVAHPNFFAGLYYMMGELWGERGKIPEIELLEHVGKNGEVSSPDRDLLTRMRRLARLLVAANQANHIDAQRLLKQVLPGGSLLLAEISTVQLKPTYLLACTRADSTAFLLLPGTRNPADVATDLNAAEEPIGEGFAHRGMVQCAQWLCGEVSPALLRLHAEGFRIVVVGHSLGAAVGGLLSLLLKPQIPTIFCYGFGTPACVDEKLVPVMYQCMISVVNRDDMIPRLSLKNVVRLAEETVCPAQATKTSTWMAEDWKALQDIKRLAELRRRNNPIETEEALDSDKVKVLVEAGVDRQTAERVLRLEGGDVSLAMLRATQEEQDDTKPQTANESDGNAADSQQSLQVSAPPEEATTEKVWQDVKRLGFAAGSVMQSWSSQAVQRATATASTASNATAGAPLTVANDTTANVPAVKHVDLFVPGRIIHLFKQNGLSRAAHSSCTHETFNRLVPTTDLLYDHYLSTYVEALHEACIEHPATPKWESFDDREVCSNCSADFNWAYVLKSEPQRMLARHHCCACGQVVCDGCCQRRLAHERLGFRFPVRTCDRCYFDRYGDAGEQIIPVGHGR